MNRSLKLIFTPFGGLCLLFSLCAPPLYAQSGNVVSEKSHREMALSAVGRTHSYDAPMVAVKTNLLYGFGTLTPNLGLEVGLTPRSTFEGTFGYNGWNLDGTDTDNRKLAHWVAQGEYRRWMCERFNGHFFGVHAMYARYNIGGYELPLLFGKGSKDYRYDGYMAGGGVSYGYNWMFGKRWNLEATIGVGYGYMKYDQYDCPRCGRLLQPDKTRHYFGPTKAGITLVYMIR